MGILTPAALPKLTCMRGGGGGGGGGGGDLPIVSVYTHYLLSTLLQGCNVMVIANLVQVLGGGGGGLNYHGITGP